MSKMNIRDNELTHFIEEKGDLEHVIRCTEQAEKRAEIPWLKHACAFRLKMLRLQLSKKMNYNRTFYLIFIVFLII